MPFKILAIAPFKPSDDAAWTSSPIQVDMENVDHVINELGVSLYIPMPVHLHPEGGIDIPISGLKDFHPDHLVQKIPALKNLKEAITYIEKSTSEGKSLREIGERIKAWPHLPAIDIAMDVETKRSEPSAASSAIDTLLNMVALPEEEKESPAQKRSMIQEINHALQEMLTHIFSHQAFIELESIWQGVKLLLKQGVTNEAVILEIVPASSPALSDTLDSLTATLIDDLPSLIIVDLPFDNSPLSLERLEKIALFAERLMVPAICWVTEKFLYLDDWDELKKLPFLPNHLDQSHYAKWHGLEQASCGNWLSVTCNRMLARYPYGKENKPRTVDFTEQENRWIAPMWAVAALMSKSVGTTGWPTHFTDHQTIKMEDLPLHAKNPDKPIPTETVIIKDRMDHFKRIGIMPLTAIDRKDIAFTSIETTVAGGSLRYHLFLSQFTKFIFWCLDTLEKRTDASSIENSFGQAMTLFFEKKGSHSPADLQISASTPTSEDRISLKISFTPPNDVLPSKEKVELEFLW